MFQIVLNFMVLSAAILALNIFSVELLVFNRMDYASLVARLVSVAFMVFPMDSDED
jgi:hypothetical protein